MNIVKAKTAGFCFGVERAVNMVYNEAGKSNVYTYGPIIHNEEVVKDLELKGIKVLNNIKEVNAAEKGTVIIRAHGVPETIYSEIRKAGHKIIDATCPFVLKIHNIVKEAAHNGEYIIIIGNPNHPEVQGIKSCSPENSITVIEDKKAAIEFINNNDNRSKDLCIVSQTTFNYNKFQELVEIFQKNSYHNINVLNTICNATEERQLEARQIASEVDTMLVIGGNNSSNTQKLYEICRENCEKTFFIQTADDLHIEDISCYNKVGITAGASTPNKIIEEVQTKCQI